MSVTTVDRTRRDEILATAAGLFASSGYRVSVHDIAGACGIVPAGLYHHFASKDAIVVELAARYYDDLERLAGEVADDSRAQVTAVDQVVAVGRAIADCAVRNRAAVLLTFYEPPAGSSGDLSRLARAARDTITRTVRCALDDALDVCALRAGVDADDLADRIGQSMVHVAVGAFHRTRAGRGVPELKCRILLQGIVDACPPDRWLDGSAAHRVASAEVDRWQEDHAPTSAGDRLGRIVDAARDEFGRRGYEVTTMREVAAAAGVSTAALYRETPSKESLLLAIMRGYFERVDASWRAVLRSSSSPTEKLDALLWLDVNVVERFAAERRIEMAWLRQSPPSTPSIGPAFAAHLRGMRTLVAAGVEAGEFVTSGSRDVVTRSLYALAWTPAELVERLGTRDALQFARGTVLRGAVARRR